MTKKAISKPQSDPSIENNQYLGEYSQHLASQGYSECTQSQYRATAVAVITKMIEERLTPPDLCDELMAKWSAELVNSAYNSYKSHTRFRFEQLRDFLIEYADAPKRAEPEIDTSPRACLRRDYEDYLTVQRGLATRTIYHSLRFYDLFLTSKFGDGLGDLDSITSDDIAGFILKIRKNGKAPRDKTVPNLPPLIAKQ